MKDYLLQIKIKNGPMMGIMRANNMDTAAELSRKTGVTQTIVGKYLNLQSIPFDTAGRWKETVVRISEFLKVPPEMLFPEQHLTKALKDNVIEGEVSLEEMKELVSTAGVDQISETIQKDSQDELHDRLERGWESLHPRERRVLELRFGINQEAEKDQTHTYGEVGEGLGVTGDRIRQIEAKALRKLRHPRHSEARTKRNNNLKEEP